MAEAKKKDPYSQWYWADWKACPEVRACSLTARGLWLEMLALMSEADPYGHLLINGRPVTDKQLANQAGGGVSVKEVGDLLEELESAGVFSRTDDGVIYSRRMVRDKAKRDEDRANGKRGGNPKLKASTNPGVNPPDKGDGKPPRKGTSNPQDKAHIHNQNQMEVRRSEEKSQEVVVSSEQASAEKPPVALVVSNPEPSSIVSGPKPAEDFDPVRDMPAHLRRAPGLR